MKHIFIFLALSLPWLRADQAVTVAGDTYPKTVEALDTTWTLVGTDHFKYKVFFSVFTGALYEQKDGDGLRLQFTYTRDLKADDLRRTGMEQLEKTNDAETLETYSEPTKGIQKAYVDVKDGDSYAITVIPDRGTWLQFNGDTRFHTDDDDFGYWYLDIWLGDNPISDSLKAALTGKD